MRNFVIGPRTRSWLLFGTIAVLLIATGQLVRTATVAGVPEKASTAMPAVGGPTAAPPPSPVTVPSPPSPTVAAPPPQTPAASPDTAPSAAPPDPAPTAAPVTPTGVPPLTPPYEKVLGFDGDGTVAHLTFDDGPTRYTSRVLDILAASGVKATFCQVGSQIADYPEVERRIIAEGHTLCNHSWTHPENIAALPEADIAAQIGQTQQLFTQYGVTGHYFRAPGGDFGQTPTLRQLCQHYQTRPLGWSVDSEDWKKPGAARIVKNVLSTVSPGAIILLHDGGGTSRDQTMAALPGIISGLRARGYTLTALPAEGLNPR